MTRHCCLALLLCLGLSAAPARAEIALNEAGTVRFHGDLRLRAEFDWNSRRSDGTERDDRERGRVRLRLGFHWDPTEHLSFGIRGRTGNTNSQQSPHVTIVQSGDNGDGDVLIDRAWIRFDGGPGWLWIGRNGSPFWAQNEHLFDGDIYFDGLGFGFDWERGPDKHRVRGALAAPPEGEASLSLDEQGVLAGLQYAWTRTVDNGSWTLAGGGYFVDDDESVANPVLLDQDYEILMLSLQRSFQAGRLPMQLGLDLLHNAQAPPAGVHLRDERDGFVLSAKFGSLKEKGDWLFGYWFAQVEKYALVPYLAQDDWLRWGSATQTRSSNYRGHELRFAYALRDDMNIVARLYVAEGLDLESPTAITKEDGNRFRIDWNWKW